MRDRVNEHWLLLEHFIGFIYGGRTVEVLFAVSVVVLVSAQFTDGYKVCPN